MSIVKCSIVKLVAKVRLWYHANMLDVNCVLNQLHMRSDSKADVAGKNHFMACLDCLEILGCNVFEFMEELEENK